jgi:hypothetical protein
MPNLPPRDVCTESGCERRPIKADRCWKHNKNMKPRIQRVPCSFNDCPNAAYKDRELCYLHDIQDRNGDELTPVGLRGTVSKVLCLHPGCKSKPKINGFCGDHVVDTSNQNVCGITNCGDFKIASRVMCQRHNTYWRKFNLSPLTYRDMINGGCEICGSRERMAIDHDHSCCPKAAQSCGKCVRGALCGNCNNMLGHAKRTETLRRGADYLDRWSGIPNSIA